MWSSNVTRGSQRIQAELARLGLAIAGPTVRKYRPEADTPTKLERPSLPIGDLFEQEIALLWRDPTTIGEMVGQCVCAYLEVPRRAK